MRGSWSSIEGGLTARAVGRGYGVRLVDAESYLNRPYTVTVQHRDDGDGTYWFATVEELPGCMSDGDTEEEARTTVRDAMHGWLSAALEDGRPIPQPQLADPDR